MPDRELDSEYPQFEREVDSLPVINGAKCLVWIDVTAVGGAFALSTVQSTGVGATDQELGDAIHAAIVAKIQAECPEGPVKLEFQYHCDAKPVEAGNGRTRDWQQQNSIESALRRLGQEQIGELIQKVYFKGCYSDRDLNLVDAAFGLRGTQYVVTVDDIIFLVPPGVIAGGDTTFRPRPVGVTIWKKDGDRQVAQKSGERVDADERYNIHTGTIEDQSGPVTGPCPTVTRLTGSERKWVMSGSVKAVDSYIDTLTASGLVDQIATGVAAEKAGAQAEAHGCPNPHCQKKRIATPVISNVYFTRIQSFLWGLLLRRRYTGYMNFDWSADMWCE